MAKLDVELGKAVGIQRTKAGSGDKEEAFLIRSTLLKFAGAFCLVFLIVGGLAIFLSQWEVSFQQGINLDERVEHEAVEQEAFTQFMQVGSLLTSFLRAEAHKKQQVNVVQVQITKAVDELLGSLDSVGSSDDVRNVVDAFSDQIYGVLDEYSELVGDEASRAKELLGSVNNLMASDDVMPESREKIALVSGAKNKVQKIPQGGPMDSRRGGGPGGRGGSPGFAGAGGPAAGRDGLAGARPNAKQQLAELGGDLTKTIERVFERVEALDQLTFPDKARDALVSLQHEVVTAQHRGDSLAPYLEQFAAALSQSNGVRGVDVATATSSERQMLVILKEIVQLFPVLDHVEELEDLKMQWEAQELDEGQAMHELHKLTREQILPFEWVAGGHPFGGQGRRGGHDRAASGRPGAKEGIFAPHQKYTWWSGLKEEQ